MSPYIFLQLHANEEEADRKLAKAAEIRSTYQHVSFKFEPDLREESCRAGLVGVLMFHLGSC